MSLIRFRRLSRPSLRRNGVEIEVWEIAFDEQDLMEKLNGEMAEVIMPPEPWYIRLWRLVFPLKPAATYRIDP